jgi:hypothetical protein
MFQNITSHSESNGSECHILNTKADIHMTGVPNMGMLTHGSCKNV